MAVMGGYDASQSFADMPLSSDSLLGGGLPPIAEHHLQQAGLAYQDDDVAEQHLQEAQWHAPRHAAVLIGLYRFYFYKGRLNEALKVARACLEEAAHDNRLKADWREVAPGDAAFGSYDAALPRFYMFTLKAYAYLHLRLGHAAEGRDAVLKLLELDPADRIGARVLLDVIDRTERSDDD